MKLLFAKQIHLSPHMLFRLKPSNQPEFMSHFDCDVSVMSLRYLDNRISRRSRNRRRKYISARYNGRE